MSFLGLSFLFALPLIALPVIIHLYRGRQRDVISWGAMQFLEQATTKGRSVQRLEELLLMFLRVAALAALILALARPMLQSTWLGTSVDREVILVLDNSLSMSRTIENVSAFDQMIENAVETIDELSSADRVNVMLASGGGQWLTAEGIPADSAGRQRLTDLLQDQQPSLGTANVLDCLQIAVNSEPHDNPSSRRVVVFSDSQTLSWQLDSIGGWRQLGSARENSSVPTSIEVVGCGFEDSELQNLAMTRIEASRKLVRPDEQIEFTARITNAGDSVSKPTTVEWLVDDKVFDTSELRSLAVGESTLLATRLKQADSGNFAITCRIEAEDQIMLDGEASVVVEVSDQLPILVVYDIDADESTKTADELFTAALGYDGSTAKQWHAIYRPELISTDEFADVTLSKYRAVVMLNLADLPTESQERLDEFVRSGGGLWLALGDLVDRDAFNRFWHDDGGGLSPISLEDLVSVRNSNSPEGLIHPPEPDHPATMQLANTTQLDIDQVRLTDYWRLAHNGDQQREVWMLLESGDGSPLVVENLVGNGRVLVQAFPLGMDWSNLPKLKSYVVMIHDWLDYLTAPAMARYNLEPGNAISVPLPENADVESAKLVTPAGKEVAPSVRGGDEGGLVRYSQTQLPGLYRLTFDAGDSKVSLPFYVARDPKESKWESLAAEDQSQLLDLAGLQFAGSDAVAGTATTNVEPRPRSEPIWGVLLLVLVVILIGEQLLSNWLARQRSGVAVTT